jgi:hypothetical protein
MARAVIRNWFDEYEENDGEEGVAPAVLLRNSLDSRQTTSLVVLEGSYSYKIDYSGDF